MKIKNYLVNLFKQKEDLTLIHVHTFKTGEKLYTYKDSDWGKITSRYYHAIQGYLAHLEILGLTKAEWESTQKLVIDVIDNALAGDTVDKVRALSDIRTTFLNFDMKTKSIKTISESLTNTFFCMFYLLEEEDKYGYNEALNAKKIDLINKEPEMRDVFFSQVSNSMKSYYPSSAGDIYSQIITLNQQMESLRAMKALNDTMKKLN